MYAELSVAASERILKLTANEKNNLFLLVRNDNVYILY